MKCSSASVFSPLWSQPDPEPRTACEAPSWWSWCTAESSPHTYWSDLQTERSPPQDRPWKERSHQSEWTDSLLNTYRGERHKLSVGLTWRGGPRRFFALLVGLICRFGNWWWRRGQPERDTLWHSPRWTGLKRTAAATRCRKPVQTALNPANVTDRPLNRGTKTSRKVIRTRTMSVLKYTNLTMRNYSIKSTQSHVGSLSTLVLF